MNVPRVTVGLPVFNGERYLAEAVESILAQDFKDFELLVADNASTDRTARILRELAERDGRIRVIRHRQNLGAAYNYSCLVKHARGEYFKWASADDVVRPQLLSRCVAVLDGDPGVVLAYAKTTLIDGDGVRMRDHEDRLHLPQPEPWLRLRDFAAKRWLCNPCFGLIRTDALRTTSLLTPNVSSDITLLAELALRGRFHEIPERLFLRRVVASSCGLGELSSDEVAAWFDPRRTHTLVPPLVKVFFDIERAIWRSEHPAGVRLRTTVAFSRAWCKRQAGIQRWKLMRRLRQQPRQSWLTAAEDV